MAASRAAGISDNIGSMTKATHSGNAARNGLECCLLSKAGFTASSKTFEAPGGWGEVFGGDNFYGEQLRLGMSHVSCFNNPGFAFKKWPAHTAMQIAINAALGIEQPINTLDIAIVIKTPIFNYCDRPFPKSGDECRFSFQFNVVKALLDKEITNESYTLDSLNDSNVQQLLGKTTLIMSPDIPATFHEMWVEIELSNGIKSYSENWPGHWKTSANDVQHVKKFTDSASKLFNSSKSLQLISCFDLESNNINLSQLKGILSK
jgi:2-methylcitrate dehydratase PrpD